MSSAHITFDTTGDKIARRVRKMRPSAVRNLFAAATRDDVISLSGGMPAVSLLPEEDIRRATLAAIRDDEADLIVGTHAILSEGVEFARLGLAVVDEQHRFGVRQRGMLAEKAENPHLLVEGAAPIPRTLGLLIYGDLDISILDELPPGRKPV